MVTKISREARRISDYVIFMYMGEIIEHGPTEQLFEDPQEQLTKDYVKSVFS